MLPFASRMMAGAEQRDIQEADLGELLHTVVQRNDWITRNTTSSPNQAYHSQGSSQNSEARQRDTKQIFPVCLHGGIMGSKQK